MANELTPKQTLFLKLYLDPDSETFGNGTKSALIAYDTDDYSTAANIASDILKKPEIIRLMEVKGIGLGRLLKKLDEGLEATRTISALTGKNAKGTDMDFIDVPDYSVRHKYLETAAKWYGIEGKEAIGVRSDGESIEVVIKSI